MSLELEQAVAEKKWESVSNSEKTIRMLAAQYKKTPKRVWQVAEKNVLGRIENADIFRREAYHWGISFILIFGAIVAVIRACTPESTKSGLLFAQILVAFWLPILAAFNLLHPRYSRWVFKIAVWWAGVLGGVLTVVVPLWIESEKSPRLGTLVQIIFYGWTWMAAVILGALRLTVRYNRMLERIAENEKEHQVLMVTRVILK